MVQLAAIRRKRQNWKACHVLQDSLQPFSLSSQYALTSTCCSHPARTENILWDVIPASDCDYHRQSFSPRTVIDWNTLLQEVDGRQAWNC